MASERHIVEWDKHLPSILTVGGSLLTGVFALLGVWLANRSSQKQLTLKLDNEVGRENRERRLERLEELYSLVGRWEIEFSLHHLTYLRVMKGELTYNQALEIGSNHKSPGDATRLFTLAELYFTSAHGSLNELKQLRGQLAKVQSDFKDTYKLDGSPSLEHAMRIVELLQRFDVAIKTYKAELAAHGTKL